MVASFYTPDSEQSFSALVDQVILETGKTGALRSAISYANATIKECQVLGLFALDLVEDSVVATANPHIWTRPRFFRSLLAVQYQTQGVYPKMRRPGAPSRNLTSYFYAADDYYAFKGPLVGETIALGYYSWSVPLLYWGRLGTNTNNYPGGPYALRPAYFDAVTLQWLYLNDTEDAYITTTGDDAVDALRQRVASHWLLENWLELVREGTKAKIFKQFGDDRANLSYALYKEMQKALSNTTGFEAEASAIIGE